MAALTTSPCSADLYTPDTISLWRSKNSASSAISRLFFQAPGFSSRLGRAPGFQLAPELCELRRRSLSSHPSLVARRPRNSLRPLKAGTRVSTEAGRAQPRATGSPRSRVKSLTAMGTKPSRQRPGPAPRQGGKKTTSGPLYPGIPPTLWSSSSFPW